MMQITPVVKQLLIINVLLFFGSQFVENLDALFSLYYFQNPMFRFWQPLTSMFMHANVMHIFFNMFALFSFGSALEHFWGGTKFLFFYISCGLGAALLHTGVNFLEIQYLLNQVNYSQEQFDIIENANIILRTPAVGASGAIYGLLVAFAFMIPNAELSLMFIPIPIKAKYFVPGILVIDLIFGFRGSSIFGASSTGIAHFAHLGGAITGFIMMWYWKKNQFNNTRWN
jgi:membrane associated rhomboid family serine protease